MTSKPYTGDEKVVFAIDCGTTMTAVSYVHLLHGVTPNLQVVNRWPFQQEAVGNYKVPTVVRYNALGTAVAFGAEAVENPDTLPGTELARWFKLLLHPQEMRDENNLTAPPLPPGVALLKVYTDFLGFVYQHAATCFQRGTLDGPAIWDRLRDSFELVFAVPNGWSGSQQHFIREAVIAAGILPEDFAEGRLNFVSEAEASVHFALEYMNIGHLLRPETNFLILDAGGSTVDATVYKCEAVAPSVVLTEVTGSECVQAGSVFVDHSAEFVIRTILAGSKFSANEYIDEIMAVFETKTKRRFTGLEDQTIIHFGRNADNDSSHRIRMGRLTLSTHEMKNTFDRSISAIVSSVSRVLRKAQVSCKTVLLVGGFAESEYLRRVLQERLAYRGLEFVYSDEPARKAAAEGAAAWRVRQYVVARAARCTYGIHISVPYYSFLPDHVARRNRTFIDFAGVRRVPGALDVLVTKDLIVPQDRPAVHSYNRKFLSEPLTLENWTVELLVADEKEPGSWVETETGDRMPGLRPICTISADLSGLKGSLESVIGRRGVRYWQVNFDVELFFGRTSLCAGIVWKENGLTKKGPASVIPNSICL